MTRIRLAAFILTIFFIATGTAHADISSQDQQKIGQLRTLYSFDSSVTDTDLAQLLESPTLGVSLSGDLNCAEYGFHPFDRSDLGLQFLTSLVNNVGDVKRANELIDTLTSRISFGGELGAVWSIHQELDQFADELPGLVTTIKDAYTEDQYLSLLSGYSADWAQNQGDREQTDTEFLLDYGDDTTYLAHLAKERSLTFDQLLDQFAYQSSCISLAQDNEQRLEYANYIDTLVEAEQDYTRGGTSGLVVVPTSPSDIEVINAGKGYVSQLAVRLDGSTIAHGPALDPGDSERLDLGSDADLRTATLQMTVDEVAGISTDVVPSEQDVYFGAPLATDIDGDPSAKEFDLSSGPFVRYGVATPAYKWTFDDGTSSSEPDVPHHYGCPGTYNAQFSAGTMKSPNLSVTISAGYDVDFSADDSFAVAPGVPLTFHASRSIPADATITWNYGDGHTETGTSTDPTHTFSAAGIRQVSISVQPKGSGCPALSMTHNVTVGRSTDWIPISGSIGDYTMTSTVAGYYLAGVVTVPAGRTLTIEPGTNIKAVGAAGDGGQLFVNGTLDVRGTAGAPVVFTSGADDTAGGHCSCTSSHTPSHSDWYGINTRQSGGVIELEHADIRYATTGVWLQASGSTIDIHDSVFEDGGGISSGSANDITLDHTTFAGTGASFGCFGCTYTPKLTNDVFRDTETAVDVSGGAAPRIDHATFDSITYAATLEPGALRTIIAHSTTLDGSSYVYVFSGTTPRSAVTLSADLPYLLNGSLTIPAGGQLTVGPGTVVKGSAGSISSRAELFVAGTLLVAGADEAPAVFTSQYDDSVGGDCACTSAGRTPSAGDWYGISTSGTGGAILLQHADLRYGGEDIFLQGTGATVDVWNSVIEHAFGGIQSSGPNSITADGSTFSDDNVGLDLSCFGCTYAAAITDSTFHADGTGLTLDDGPTATIHGSSFDAAMTGVTSTSRDVSDARDNWWGAPSGPRPNGAGAKVTGNVDVAPYCAAAGCAAISLVVSPAGIVSNGSAQTVATATLLSGGIPVAGHTLAFATTDPGERIGLVTDNGDGTYSAVITASKATGTATITATDMSADPAVSATATLVQGPSRRLALTVKPRSIVAGSATPVVATIKVRAGGTPQAGDPVTLRSSDAGQRIGTIVDNGDGTYTASISASTTVDAATFTASDAAIAPTVTDTAALEQTAPRLAVSLKPASIAADGTARTVATARITIAGDPQAGQDVTFVSTDAGEHIGPVSDNRDGTYSATIISSAVVGVSEITATDSSISPTVSKSAALAQVPPTIRLAVRPGTLAANGRASAVATATITGAGRVIGDQVSFSSTDPDERIGLVTDNGDGTYSATITASQAVGTSTITAMDDSAPSAAAASEVLQQIAPSVALALSPTSIKADGTATTVATVTVRSAGGRLAGETLAIAASDPTIQIGAVTDNGDGTYTATITASAMAETVTVTATDETPAPTVSDTARLRLTKP